jgi:hypothetical protein
MKALAATLFISESSQKVEKEVKPPNRIVFFIQQLV